MPCTIVVGGQYGSEGKGKTVALLAKRLSEPFVVRCGGPNSGHSVTVGDRSVVFRQLPAAAPLRGARLFLAAGCAIDPQVLISEIAGLQLERQRVVVDPRAVIIDESDRIGEQDLVASIGSTGTGTGAALVRRIRRSSDVRFAADSEVIAQHATIAPVAPILHERLRSNGHVLIEGTQGFGLSLLHGRSYPFVTSRDTTASAFASEVGLAPSDITQVVMVIRTFPIRVGGPSGPIPNECSWNDIAALGGEAGSIPEYTSVTARVRRVARFDLSLVADACAFNKPSTLAIMGMDRLDVAVRGARSLRDLTPRPLAFSRMVEQALGVPVEILGTGFRSDEFVEVAGGIENYGDVARTPASVT